MIGFATKHLISSRLSGIFIFMGWNHPLQQKITSKPFITLCLAQKYSFGEWKLAPKVSCRQFICRLSSHYNWWRQNKIKKCSGFELANVCTNLNFQIFTVNLSTYPRIRVLLSLRNFKWLHQEVQYSNDFYLCLVVIQSEKFSSFLNLLFH